MSSHAFNKINYGRDVSLVGYGAYALDKPQALAGISFGKTSAKMACMLPDEVLLCFDNTGLEHEKTLEFGARLEDALQREIHWLEFRPPAKYGDPLRYAQSERVNFQTASRKGEPFIMMMEAVAAYRKTHKEQGPISPWPRSRICTSYLKHRVHNRYVEAKGFTEYESFVGLRADEPSRVQKLRNQETRTHTFRCPLYDAGDTVDDVNRFWERQSFTLELPPGWGNCTGCFLKDQWDLVRNLGMEGMHRDVWFHLEDNYPNFGGQHFPGYRKLYAELPARLAIESALRLGDELPPRPPEWSNRKFLYVIRDEKEHIANGSAGFSCACENSYLDGYADDL